MSRSDHPFVAVQLHHPGNPRPNADPDLTHQRSQEPVRNYDNAIDQASIISVTNQVGEITYTNENFRKLYGYSFTQLIGRDHRLINSGVHDKEFFKDLWDTIRSGYIWRGETCNRAKDGTLFWVDNTIVPFENEKDGPNQFLVIGKEITEKKNQQINSNSYNDHLRQLAFHYQDLREEDRNAVGYKIQEELGQQLTALKFEVSILKSQLKDEASHKTAIGIMQLVNQSISMVRKMAADLRPSVLFDLGLMEALQWKCNEFGRGFGIKIGLINKAGEIELPFKTKLALFRIFQESLTNIGKYAEASQVFVELKIESGMLQLTVQDDGKGFNPGKQQPGQSFGLSGMKEAAIMMDGRMEVSTAPGQGTKISILVPMNV
jgi:PAS domain S-box-containing protein